MRKVFDSPITDIQYILRKGRPVTPNVPTTTKLEKTLLGFTSCSPNPFGMQTYALTLIVECHISTVVLGKISSTVFLPYLTNERETKARQ